MREERLSKMEAYIRLQKSVSLDTLCEVFGISKNTVRRDIADIIARTDIRKIYGGVSIPYNKIPPPFEERMSINTDKKDCIGRLASSLVEDGDIICGFRYNDLPDHRLPTRAAGCNGTYPLSGCDQPRRSVPGAEHHFPVRHSESQDTFVYRPEYH